MKNRNVPFGYQYREAKIVVHSAECAVIKEICQAYLDGKSLKEICDILNFRQIEYQPGVVSWNKARLMRIIEDERYLGSETYPAILDPELFYNMQEKKLARRTYHPELQASKIHDMKVPILCPVCGSTMKRRYDSRCQCSHRWTCSNSKCKKVVEQLDADLLQNVEEIIRYIAVNPQILRSSHQNDGGDAEILRGENEIRKELIGDGMDKDALRKKMLQLASLKFRHLDSFLFTTRSLQMCIAHAKEEEIQSTALYNKIIASIKFRQDGGIIVTFVNGQSIRREELHGSCSAEESS